jgi:hypothetical protein
MLVFIVSQSTSPSLLEPRDSQTEEHKEGRPLMTKITLQITNERFFSWLRHCALSLNLMGLNPNVIGMNSPANKNEYN